MHITQGPVGGSGSRYWSRQVRRRSRRGGRPCSCPSPGEVRVQGQALPLGDDAHRAAVARERSAGICVVRVDHPVELHAGVFRNRCDPRDHVGLLVVRVVDAGGAARRIVVLGLRDHHAVIASETAGAPLPGAVLIRDRVQVQGLVRGGPRHRAVVLRVAVAQAAVGVHHRDDVDDRQEREPDDVVLVDLGVLIHRALLGSPRRSARQGPPS